LKERNLEHTPTPITEYAGMHACMYGSASGLCCMHDVECAEAEAEAKAFWTLRNIYIYIYFLEVFI
jgi:hypothetical protein